MWKHCYCYKKSGFLEQKTILAFDVDPGESVGLDYWVLLRSGVTQLELKLKIPLPHPVYVITNRTFPTMLGIDEVRNIGIIYHERLHHWTEPLPAEWYGVVNGWCLCLWWALIFDSMLRPDKVYGGYSHLPGIH